MKKFITMALLMCLGYVVAQAGNKYKYSGRIGLDQISKVISVSSAWQIGRGKLHRSMVQVFVGNRIMELYSEKSTWKLYLVDVSDDTKRVYSLTDKANEYFKRGYLSPGLLTENTNLDVSYFEYYCSQINLPQIKFK